MHLPCTTNACMVHLIHRSVYTSRIIDMCLNAILLWRPLLPCRTGPVPVVLPTPYSGKCKPYIKAMSWSTAFTYQHNCPACSAGVHGCFSAAAATQQPVWRHSAAGLLLGPMGRNMMTLDKYRTMTQLQQSPPGKSKIQGTLKSTRQSK